jgi:hypothetical protein
VANASGRQAHQGDSHPPPSMAGKKEGSKPWYPHLMSHPANAAASAGRGGDNASGLPQLLPHGRGGHQANKFLLSFYPFYPFYPFFGAGENLRMMMVQNLQYHANKAPRACITEHESRPASSGRVLFQRDVALACACRPPRQQAWRARRPEPDPLSADIYR